MSTPLVKAIPENVTMVAQKLREGEVVALPTETVYGLAADATQREAISRVYEAKGRPRVNPLIAHVSSLEMAHEIAVFSDVAESLARSFWPGALTMVLPQRTPSPLSPEAFSGKPTLAVRMPKHEFTLGVIAALGHPIVAPSANLSGHVSPTTAQHVADDLSGLIDWICDGGQCQMGLESTIVKIDAEDIVVLRHGLITIAQIEHALGRNVQQHSPKQSDDKAPDAPGMMLSHYAPKCPVRLNGLEVFVGEAFLGFGDTAPKGLNLAVGFKNLSESKNPNQAAHNLYAHLRELDLLNPSAIVVAPIPQGQEWDALQDRLKRASTPTSE